MSAVSDPGRPMPLGWRDRLLAWRHAVIANPRFQRFAASFPPTRALSGRKARGLFDIATGFVGTQVLTACVRLDLFERLAERPLSVDEVAAQAGLPRENALRLLRAATAYGLLSEREGGRYGLGDHGAALRGNPGVIAMVRHNQMLYADLADPLALLRGQAGETSLSRYWAYAGAGDPSDPDDVSAYTRLMAASQDLVADDILDAFDMGRFGRIMDVGGGSGGFLARVAMRAAQAELTLFDLPAVVAQAQALPRLNAVGGSFLTDALPEGADLITLIRIVHDHDEPSVRTLFARCHAALAPGGTLLIGEPMAGRKGAETMADGYFGLYFLAMGQGRARRPDELAALLAEAGFRRIRMIPTRRPLLTSIMVAEKADRLSVNPD